MMASPTRTMTWTHEEKLVLVEWHPDPRDNNAKEYQWKIVKVVTNPSTDNAGALDVNVIRQWTGCWHLGANEPRPIPKARPRSAMAKAQAPLLALPPAAVTDAVQASAASTATDAVAAAGTIEAEADDNTAATNRTGHDAHRRRR